MVTFDGIRQAGFQRGQHLNNVMSVVVMTLAPGRALSNVDNDRLLPIRPSATDEYSSAACSIVATS
ncbi:hypothetical protein [Streptomyces sp. HP-A2021]|uniref:hypothetical protein n=1 Tax=Streptomyces sp. HP-A2021 TaxID=2927875 RepID=UPI002434CE80|nr:hypothetical protein [Streptomyces sp. HP-A2021]